MPAPVATSIVMRQRAHAVLVVTSYMTPVIGLAAIPVTPLPMGTTIVVVARVGVEPIEVAWGAAAGGSVEDLGFGGEGYGEEEGQCARRCVRVM